MIARALVSSPELLILDEATTGLEESVELSILDNIVEMKDEMAILVISHQAAVKGVADRVVDLNSSGVV